MTDLPESSCSSESCGLPEETAAELSRRGFLRKATALGAAAISLASGCDFEGLETFFQKNFRELGPDEVADLVASLSAKYTEKYGKEVTVGATPAKEGVVYGYGLDLSRCVGCRRCVYACVKENNQSREPQVHWIRVLEQEIEKGVDLEGSNAYYDAEKVPREGMFYIPVACQQCAEPECTKTCPVGATWQEPDGIVVIDYDWCIGCRCCMAACPYGARHFNWGDAQIPEKELNPNMHVLGNRPRPRGVVEKCTFCIQRVREGRYPACVEICPVGARKFGDMNDPESEIRYLLKNKRVFVLKAELNTKPRFFYFYST